MQNKDDPTLSKISVLTCIATMIGVICNFITAKIIAFFLGPSGLALISQFQNFTQIAQNCSGGMFGHGIVKYVSEYRNEEDKKAAIISTAFLISIGSSVLFSLIIFFFRNIFSKNILHDAHYAGIIGIFSFSFTFYVLNAFFIEVMNGERDIKKLTICNIITNMTMLGLALLLVKRYEMTGGLLIIVLNPIIAFVVCFFFITGSKWFAFRNLIRAPAKDWMVNLFKYALMTVVSALLIPISQLFLRDHIVHTLSWQEAGYWDAITKISNAYLLVISNVFVFYYLPKLSELSSNKSIFQEINKGYKTILPASLLLALLFFIFKKKIIILLFTSNFLPAIALFKYQLIGDIFKVAAWLISYVMLAKAMSKLFIITEVLFSVIYCLLGYLFINYFGLIGITLAFAIAYGIYWLFMVFYFLIYAVHCR